MLPNCLPLRNKPKCRLSVFDCILFLSSVSHCSAEQMACQTLLSDIHHIVIDKVQFL